MRIQDLEAVSPAQILKYLDHFSAFFQQRASADAKAFSQFIQSLPLSLQVKGGIIVMRQDTVFPTKKGQQLFTLISTGYETLVVGDPKVPLDPPNAFHFFLFPLADPPHFLEQ